MPLPPFELSISVPADPTAAYQLDIRLHPKSDPPPNPLTGEAESMNPSDEMVQLFAACAQCQMFRSAPGKIRSKFHLAAGGRGHPGRIWLYRFHVAAVAPQAYRVLLALLAQAVYQGDPLSKVEIIAHDNVSVTLMSPQSLLGQKLIIPRTPGIETPPMKVDQEALESGSFGVEIGFESKIAAETREFAERGLAAWDEVRVFGGFLLDFQEQEDTGNLGSISLTEPTIVRNWIIDFYEGEFSGFHMIFNLAAALHQQMQPVRAVVCE